MRMTGLFCGVVAVSALMGCSDMIRPMADSVPLTTFKCTYDVDCRVLVSVTNTNPCVVTVDRPDIEMKGSSTFSGVTHLIRWELDEAADDARFRFDADKGVLLKTPDQDGQFSGQSPQGGAKQYHWRDKNTNYRTYDYEINIVQKNSTNRCRLDPRVINN